MSTALLWYVALTIVGAGAVLPLLQAFGGLRSGGVWYAKPVGLLLVALFAWLTSAETHAPYGLPLVLVGVVLLWVWTGALVWMRPALMTELRRRVAQIAAGEVLFLVLFAIAIVARMQTPNATDTEKPMDLMLLTSIRGASTMPPIDGWYGGVTLSYYHLGHVMVDVVGRIAGIGPGIEMILGVAGTVAMAGVAIFGLAGDIVALSAMRQRVSPWLAGSVAVVSLLFLATLEGFFELLSAHGVGAPGLWASFGVDGLPGTQFVQTGVPTQFWWWWRATRILPGTITEFPAFSVILGDPHAHLLALPLGVTAIATALPAFSGKTPLNWSVWRRNPAALVISGAVFAGLAMTNAWDAVIYGAVWGAAVLAVISASGWPLFGGVMVAGRYFALPALAAGLIAWPFLASLQSVPVGLHLFNEVGSDPTRFLLVFLPLLLPLLVGIALLRPTVRRDAVLTGAAGLAAIVLTWGASNVIAGQSIALSARGHGWYTLAMLVVGFAVAAAACASAMKARETACAAVFGLAALACAIVLATELFFLRDALGDRMNTVFKFWYAVWVVLAVAGGAAVGLAYDRMVSLRPRWIVFPALLLCAVVYGGALLYAPAATVARSREGQEASLDSVAYLGRVDPGAAGAVVWIRSHLNSKDIVLEAVGRDYSEAAVVSSTSGVPTLMGWRGHELTWRGNIAGLGTRFLGAAYIYGEGATADSAARARELGVTYVYIGREEIAQYGASIASKFAAWDTVYAANGSRVVRVPVEAAR